MSTRQLVRVALGERSYDILVGARLIEEGGELLAPVLARPRVVVVTDANVAALHLERLTASLARAKIRHDAVVLPPGEATKDWRHLESLLDRLLAQAVERTTTLVALGGGVIGDLVGFAASIALRGIAYVQVPTTLLAQVDSAVGGKTAINTRHGKNLVGSFHQPRLVLADIEALATLPKRELLAGYAEVAKYGLLGDAAFFAWLEEHGPALVRGEGAALQRAVARSCELKAAIVAADEREAGARALLNLGHTFAHALETETGFGHELLHGEAVALGMVMAFELSVHLGYCPPADAARVRRHLAAMGLPTALPRSQERHWDAERLLAHMSRDKKVRDGHIAFVLARGIGEAFLAPDVAPAAVRTLLDAAIAA